MTKQSITKILFTILISMMGINALAYDIKIENADGKTIYYNYINDGKELEVTDGNAPYSGVVNIPETVTFMNRTRKVTSIKSFTFYYSRDITSITIPCSVTNIGKSAFEKCSRLTSVHISDIAAWCNINFEEPYTSNPLIHARHLYMNGEEIQDLIIPNDVKSIKAGAFYGCFGLTSATIPEGVTEIGESAFCDCRNLISVSIPNSVKSIGKYAFDFNDRLTAVHITDIAAWCEIDFVGYYYWSNPLYYAHHLYVNGIEIKDLVIPDGVKSIGNFAFGGCSGFTSVTIPNSVTSIGVDAFEDCDIPTIVSHIEKPSEIDNNTFTQNTLKNATLYVPEGTIEKYKATDGWKEFLFIESITELESKLFKLSYTIDGEEYKVCEVKYGVDITPENTPEREGYTFSGWSEIPKIMPPHDVTVTGAFTVNTYTLTYIIDGEVYKTSEVDYGTTNTPEAAPTKTGYSFSGWSEIPETMPERDVTVIGSFTIISYKLTYILDGEEYKTFEIVYDSAITPEAEPTKEGHTFSGWSDIPERMPANDVTVTGSFIVNKYQITYVIDGEVFATDYVEYGATIVPPMVEEREGYSFSGWSDIPETMPAHDIVVHASYTSGIIGVLIASQQNVRIYSPNGKKLDKLQKGLNIVILDDGTVKKVIVK